MNAFVQNIVIPIRDWVKQYVAEHGGGSDSRVDGILEKIPTAASATNQLADKSFVNSSVQTATANFRGSWRTWSDVPSNENQYPQDFSGERKPTRNDYIVVEDAREYVDRGDNIIISVIDSRGTIRTNVNGYVVDSTRTTTLIDINEDKTIQLYLGGDNSVNIQSSTKRLRFNGVVYNAGVRVRVIVNKITAGEGYVCTAESVGEQGTKIGTWRFKYSGNWEVDNIGGWLPEYQVNEEPLTSDQIAALNSGITAELVEKLRNL